MSDLIDRQAALDAVFENAEHPHEIYAAIRNLPSAQPERMRLVQKAVNTIMNTSRSNSVKDKCFRNAARLVQNAIDGEPQEFEWIPDEPERKTGKWTDCAQDEPCFYRCDQCGRYSDIKEPYCPNCGADMRGEK